MITYRGTGVWGAGKGSPLTREEIDENFYDLVQRIEGISTTDTISSIDVVNNAITIRTSSGGVYGPFTLPKAMLRPRGAWAANTAYAVDDLITVPGAGLYLVNVGHTSDATFSANKAIGGVQVYWFMMAPLEGTQGADGPVWSPGAFGTYSGLSDYDSEAAGFSYYSSDGDGGTTTNLGVIFFKNSATAGDWTMTKWEGSGGAATATAPILSGFARGSYTDGEVLAKFISTDYYLPAGLAASSASLLTAPTSNVSFPITVGGTQVGSIDFAAGSTVGTFTMATGGKVTSGTTVGVSAPATADPTAAGLTFAIHTSLSAGGGGPVVQ